MSDAVWTITAPGGVGTVTLADADLEIASVAFRVFAASSMKLRAHREIDSTDPWWAADSVVTVYRNDVPYFSGRVKETPFSGSAGGEFRELNIEDGIKDLEEIIYRESYAIGAGSILLPQAVLGMNEAGAIITTGAQITAAVDYAITQDALLQRGTIDAGLALWPSEVENLNCLEVIEESMWARPDWVLWVDHSTAPPTLHCRAKADLNQVIVEVAAGDVAELLAGKVERDKPRGVSILYRSAAEIDGTVYRNGYLDEAGATTGRKIVRAAIDLEGANMQFQKSRIQTRTLPTDGTSMTAYFKKKWPELKDMPDGAFSFSKVTFTLADEEPLPDPVCSKATRLNVTTASDLPRELVKGSIEDWMRKKVGQVIVNYDLAIIGTPTAAQKKVLDNFSGKGKTFSVTATDATTKLYTGITTFTAGENRPVGLAAAVLAAASAEQYEGQVKLSMADISAERWTGKLLTFKNGGATLFTEVIHSADVDIDAGEVTLGYGPLPYFSAGDLMELFRRMRARKPTWISAEERSSNKLGAEDNAGSKGDTVGGFDFPQTTTPPGGGNAAGPGPFHPELITSGEVGSETYEVTLTDGWVIERKRKSGAGGVKSLYPANLVSGAARTKFAMTVGQWLYCKYDVMISGEVTTDSQTIVVDAADKQSTPYQPNVGGFSGSAGTMYIPLAKLAADGLSAKVVPHGGIDHFADRGKMENIGGGEFEWIKDYDPANDNTRVKTFKDLDTDPQLKIVETGDLFLFRGNDKDGFIKSDAGWDTAFSNEFKDGFRKTAGDQIIKMSDPGGDTKTIGPGPGTQKPVFETLGSTFIINIWTTTITEDSRRNGSPDISRGSDPTTKLYVFKGLLYLTAPAGFPAPASEIDVTYLPPVVAPPLGP